MVKVTKLANFEDFYPNSNFRCLQGEKEAEDFESGRRT